MLPAVAAARALRAEAPDTLPVGIKWVNDILLGKAKVAGVLAHTHTTGSLLNSLVLGLGLNVETTPEIPPTPSVPRVTSLKEWLPRRDPGLLARVFHRLLTELASGYEMLENDQVDRLRKRYEELSVLPGRRVQIYPDSPGGDDSQPCFQGRVRGFTPDLGLLLEEHDEPVRSGRLVLLD